MLADIQTLSKHTTKNKRVAAKAPAEAALVEKGLGDGEMGRWGDVEMCWFVGCAMRLCIVVVALRSWQAGPGPVSYTHLRAHETEADL
eukprot:1548517-Rhodomonas_salina.1